MEEGAEAQVLAVLWPVPCPVRLYSPYFNQPAWARCVEVEIKLNSAVQETDVVLAREGKSSPKVQSDEWEHHPKGTGLSPRSVQCSFWPSSVHWPFLGYAPGELRR